MAKLELGGQIINWQGFRFTSLLSHTYENLIRQAAALFLSAVRQAVRGDNGSRNTVGCSRERCSETSFKGTLGSFFFLLPYSDSFKSIFTIHRRVRGRMAVLPLIQRSQLASHSATTLVACPAPYLGNFLLVLFHFCTSSHIRVFFLAIFGALKKKNSKLASLCKLDMSG